MRLFIAAPVLLVLLLSAATAPAPARVATGDLSAPATKEIAMQLVSSAENSSLDWRAQFSYIEDIRDGRGYTAGIIGFCSATGDMLAVVRAYTRAKPGNPLSLFLPALRRVNGTASHRGLGRPFVDAWRAAARDRVFRQAQIHERDTGYFAPAVALATRDGLGALGQFAYYDAAVVHGVEGLQGIRDDARERAATPAVGGDETVYLDAFLDERVLEMRTEAAHDNVDRIELTQRRFLREGNLALTPPLRWSVYGDAYQILRAQVLEHLLGHRRILHAHSLARTCSALSPLGGASTWPSTR